jgi:N-acetylneuraminic acid mutarotase
MKKIYTLSLVLLILKANYWTQKVSFTGQELIYRFSFSINDKGYLGCGTKFDSVANIDYSDFWMYDPLANSWTQEADFGGGARHFATGFTLNNKGYAGFGIRVPGINMYDLWEYDPSLNQWSQKNSLIQSGFDQPAVSFAIAGHGYLCANASGGIARVWQYDPVADSWLQKNPFPIYLLEPVSFSIGNVGYIGMGFDSLSLSNVFYRYDEQADSWSAITPFPGSPRIGEACFSISGKGYVGMGHGPAWPLYYTDFWQYDPVTDTWAQAASYLGVPRENYSYFSTSTKGYAGIGCEFQTIPFAYFNDFWEYTPGSLTGIAAFQSAQNFGLTVSPNVCIDFCHIHFWNNTGRTVVLFINDLDGRLVMEKKYSGLNVSVDENIPVSDLAPGIYIVAMNDMEIHVSKKFLKGS